MNRLIIASAVAVAAAAVSVPAVAGLSNNPSFSHKLPVHVPSQAKVVQLDDNGRVVNSRQGEHPASTTVRSPTSSGEPEPGDDRTNSSKPDDDRTNSSKPGDDSGGHGGGSGSGGGGGSGGSGGSGGGSGHGG